MFEMYCSVRCGVVQYNEAKRVLLCVLYLSISRLKAKVVIYIHQMNSGLYSWVISYFSQANHIITFIYKNI